MRTRKMKKRGCEKRMAAASALFLMLWAGKGLAEEVVIFGILPMESPVSLFKRFVPLRDFLGTRIGKKVILESAKDYSQHAARIDQRWYDIVFTAPHFALRAADGNKYQIIASYVKPLAAVVVVAEDSPLQKIKDLAGRKIGVPPEHAIVTMIGKKLLINTDSLANNKPLFRSYRTHNAAYQAVLSGQMDAALIANFIFQDARQRGVELRQLGASNPFPGIGILVASDIDETERHKILQAFIELKTTQEGKNILHKMSQPGYRIADVQQFESMRPFLNDMFLNPAKD